MLDLETREITVAKNGCADQHVQLHQQAMMLLIYIIISGYYEKHNTVKGQKIIY